jgi:hypothetical protein
MRKSHFIDEFLLLLGPINSSFFHVQMRKKLSETTKGVCSSPISMVKTFPLWKRTLNVNMGSEFIELSVHQNGGLSSSFQPNCRILIVNPMASIASWKMDSTRKMDLTNKVGYH